MGEPPGALAIPLIPTECVMDNHHSRMGTLPKRPRVIGVDGITLMPLHLDGFRLHTFIIVGLVHIYILGIYGYSSFSALLNTRVVACQTCLSKDGSDYAGKT